MMPRPRPVIELTGPDMSGPRGALAPKMHPLIAAVIDTMPSAGPWSADRREAFFTLLRNALDVSHGKADAAALVHGAGPAVGAMVSPAAYGMSPSAPPPDDRRFYVDHDGFAMVDGLPLAITDIPSGSTLWDKRGTEGGDWASILWRDIGTTDRPPIGVSLCADVEDT